MKIQVNRIDLDITPSDMDGKIELIIQKSKESPRGFVVEIQREGRDIGGDCSKVGDNKIAYLVSLLNRVDISGNYNFPSFDIQLMELIIKDFEYLGNVYKKMSSTI